MNKKILNTALILTPQNLQSRAVCKALSFLLPVKVLSFTRTRILRLEVSDLNRHWAVEFNSQGFSPVSSTSTADIVVSGTLSVMLAAQDKEQLLEALKSGAIEIKAIDQDKEIIYTALKSLNQKTLDVLVERCYAFFKLKPKPRFELKTVTISDLRSDRDIDWIRDEAIKIESSNLTEAHRLMELAHAARPRGTFIFKKVSEYRSKLNII